MAVVPFRALNPPTDGTTDALPWLQQAIEITSRMEGMRAIDFGGLTYSVSGALENTVNDAVWMNGTFHAIGNAADWAGGSMDSRGIPMQKGVIRCRGHGQTYRNIEVIGGPPGDPITITTANSVYTIRPRLANGFEDGPVGTGNYARGLSFIDCRADDTDAYGFRYASQTGGGFNIRGGGARKGMNYPVSDGTGEIPADHATGAGVLLDANDGYVDDFTPWGGEFPIHQISGGTIRIWGNHPVQATAIYKRAYFGPAGVPILTGIRIRTLGQIGTYDTARLLVERRASDWQVIVTPLVNIDIADAAVVRIRRDELTVYMEGWGSDIQGNYLDGGPIRVRDSGHTIGRQYGLPAAMSEAAAADFPSGTAIATIEFEPKNSNAEPPKNISPAINFGGKRLALYPRLGQSSFSATNLLYDQVVLEGVGHYAPGSLRYGSDNTDFGLVATYHGRALHAGIGLAHKGAADADTVRVHSAPGAPETVLSTPPGSVILNRATGHLHVKRSGTGNTGYEMLGTRFHAATTNGVETVTTDAHETVVVDTAVLTANQDLRISNRLSGILGGMIRIYGNHTGGFNRRVRIGTGSYIKDVASGRYVELWWNGTAWVVLRDVAL